MAAGSYGGWVQSRKNAKVTQTGNTVLIDHREEVLAHINENVSRAAQAVGMEAVGLRLGVCS